MRVLIAHNEYGAWSGEESAVQNIENALIHEGHEVYKFSKSSAGLSESYLKMVNALCSGIYSIKARKEIEDYLSEHQVNYAIVQNLYPFLSPSIFRPLKARGIPVIMRCPNYRLFCPNGLHLCDGQICEKCISAGRESWCIIKNCTQSFPKSIGYAIRNAFARFSGMILENVTLFLVLSEFQKKRFISAGIPEKKIYILPNYAEIPNKGDNHIQPGEKITFAGRVSPEKGISVFLEAANKLPQFQFIVAGNYSGMSGLKSAASKNVKFLGRLSRNELFDIYKQTRILIVPSLCFEGFPNVMVEAMAAGKPVICSDIGGLPEIVENGTTGLLFKPGDSGDLSEKIQYLWEKPDLCMEMGKNGYEKVVREYSPGKYYEHLLNAQKKAFELVRNNN